ncbi:MAG: hypothetical protein GY858_02675 [Candidatus Omnitrophica bacterium]|nr:hypothetical protein [Candidatus Omnitrophota bacterium]
MISKRTSENRKRAWFFDDSQKERRLEAERNPASLGLDKRFWKKQNKTRAKGRLAAGEIYLCEGFTVQEFI